MGEVISGKFGNTPDPSSFKDLPQEDQWRIADLLMKQVEYLDLFPQPPTPWSKATIGTNSFCDKSRGLYVWVSFYCSPSGHIGMYVCVYRIDNGRPSDKELDLAMRTFCGSCEDISSEIAASDVHPQGRVGCALVPVSRVLDLCTRVRQAQG